MRKLGQWIVSAVTLLCFTGCTSLYPMPDFSPSRIQEEIAVGDRVQIVATTGATYDLEVTRVELDALYGSSKRGKQYKVMYEAIKSIRVEKASGWKIATGVGATITAAAVIALVVFIYYVFGLGDDD